MAQSKGKILATSLGLTLAAGWLSSGEAAAQDALADAQSQAELAESSGNPGKAIALYEQILSSTPANKLNAQQKGLIEAKVSSLYLETHQLTQAEQHTKKAIDIALLQRQSGVEDAELNAQFEQLASAFTEVPRDLGEIGYSCALRIRETIFPMHPMIKNCAFKLEDWYLSAKQPKKAMQTLENVLTFEEQHFGKLSKQYGEVALHLSNSYHRENNAAMAEKYKKAAMAAFEHVYGAGTVTLYQKLAAQYDNIGDVDNQFRCAQRAFDLDLKKIGPGSAKVADDWMLLADAYLNQKKLDLSVKACQNSITIREKLYGSNCSEIVKPLELMKRIAIKQGNRVEARRCDARIAAVNMKVFDSINRSDKSAH